MTGLFYAFGIGLTLMAIVVSFLGLRSERFPAGRGPFAGLLGVMGLLVVLSCGFAVALAREEKEHRDEEIAEFRAEEEEEAAAQGEGSEGPVEGTGTDEPGKLEPPAEDKLDLTSPEDGSLVFDTDILSAEAGEIVIDYSNPSQVPHNVALEEGEKTIAQGETVTGGAVSIAAAELEPGEYGFYCSIPGHREAGMEGVLVVN
jgi:plastocyanin